MKNVLKENTLKPLYMMIGEGISAAINVVTTLKGGEMKKTEVLFLPIPSDWKVGASLLKELPNGLKLVKDNVVVVLADRELSESDIQDTLSELMDHGDNI